MNKIYLVSMLVGSLFFSFSPQVQAVDFDSESLALVGSPIVQSRSSLEVSLNVKLDNNQKITNRLTILKEDGKYYWQSRDRRELSFKKMKGFDLFQDLLTGGYIKVILQADGRLVYMEHISFKDLHGFTYWGVLTFYEP